MIADSLFDAVDEFTRKYQPTAVRDVRIIVFHKQPEMHEPVRSAIHRKASKAQTSGFGTKFKDFLTGMLFINLCGKVKCKCTLIDFLPQSYFLNRLCGSVVVQSTLDISKLWELFFN